MKISTIEVKTIDKAEAARMLAAFEYERQRHVNEKYVDYYARMMSRGEWLPGTEIEVAYAPNGNGHKHGRLINGQHRLHAVIESQAAIDFVVKSYDCDSEEEVAKLYGMIDTGRARNINDYLRALNLDTVYGFTPTDNQKLGSAVKAILSGFQSGNKTMLTPEQILSAMHKYSTAASVYFEILADVGTRTGHNKMRTAPVFSVALVTLDEAASIYGDEKIEKFWLGVGKNDGLRIGDPRKVAHAHLFELMFRTNADKQRKASPAYTSRYLANCFNAWVEGREFKYTRVTDTSAPINILGTQFKG